MLKEFPNRSEALLRGIAILFALAYCMCKAAAVHAQDVADLLLGINGHLLGVSEYAKNSANSRSGTRRT